MAKNLKPSISGIKDVDEVERRNTDTTFNL